VALFHRSIYKNVETGDIANWLTESEFARYQQLISPSRRRDWLTGRWAVKELIQHYLRESKALAFNRSQIEIDSGPEREPLLKIDSEKHSELSISISHAQEHAFVGLCEIKTDGYIGVDIEPIRVLNPKLYRKVLSESEREQVQSLFKDPDEGLIKIWSIKEAVYKCIKPHFDVVKSDLEVELLSDSTHAHVQLLHGKRELRIEASSHHEHGFYYSLALVPRAKIEPLT